MAKAAPVEIFLDDPAADEPLTVVFSEEAKEIVDHEVLDNRDVLAQRQSSIAPTTDMIRMVGSLLIVGGVFHGRPIDSESGRALFAAAFPAEGLALCQNANSQAVTPGPHILDLLAPTDDTTAEDGMSKALYLAKTGAVLCALAQAADEFRQLPNTMLDEHDPSGQEFHLHLARSQAVLGLRHTLTILGTTQHLEEGVDGPYPRAILAVGAVDKISLRGIAVRTLIVRRGDCTAVLADRQAHNMPPPPSTVLTAANMANMAYRAGIAS